MMHSCEVCFWAFIPTCMLVVMLVYSHLVLDSYQEHKNFTLTGRCSFVGLKQLRLKHCQYGTYCYNIQVTYLDLDDIARNVTLLEDLQSLKWGKVGCSRDRCVKDGRDKPTAVVKRWNKKGSPATLPCYINHYNLKQVIEKPPYTYNDVVHSFVWPILFSFSPLYAYLIRRFWKWPKAVQWRERMVHVIV